MKLRLDQIRIDGGTQARVSVDEKIVAEYAELYREGVEFPPVDVFFDGSDYWLADGFHRFCASQAIGNEEIIVNIHKGSRRDAILYSAGANAQHGLRRTNADKRKAVSILLKDKKWSQWSDREIARRCNVSYFLVGRVRKESHLRLIADGNHQVKVSQTRKYKRNGKTIRMKIGNKPPKSSATTISYPTGSATQAVAAMFRENSIEFMDEFAEAFNEYGTENNFEPKQLHQKGGIGATTLCISHNPIYGARDFVSMMCRTIGTTKGKAYALKISELIPKFINNRRELKEWSK